MEIQFTDVLLTVFAFVLLMVPGYVLKKVKMLPEKADSVLSTLTLYVGQPALMVVSFLKSEYSPTIAMNMLYIALLTFAVHFIMIGLVYLIIRHKGDTAKKNCVRFASVFGNCGFFGLPFLLSLFNNMGVDGQVGIYCTVVIAVFNFLNWSIGIYMVSGDKKNVTFKQVFLNPTVVCMILGVALYFIIRAPLTTIATEGTFLDVLLTKTVGSLDFLGNMVTPISMMVIGIKLANIKLKDLFLDKWAYVTSFLKLMIMPFISILCVYFLPISGLVKYTLFFCMAMPSAASTVLLSIKFGGDAESGSVFVLLSTLLSILTVPIMFLLFNGVFGVPLTI